MKKEKLSKKNKLMPFTVPEFAQKHSDLLVIVCDPKTDMIFVGHNKEMVLGTMKSADGKKLHIVRDILNASQFESNINHFITGLIEALQLPLKAGNMFYQFVDGALFNISKKLRKNKIEKGAVESPYKQELLNKDKSI